MTEIPNIDELLSDRRKFDAFVYTPLHDARKAIRERREDKELEGVVSAYLDHDVLPELTGEHTRAVLFRQIATPNYEIRRFLAAIDAIDDLVPYLGEHRDDKYTSNNEYKHSWAKLCFFTRSDDQNDYLKIVDAVKADGKKLSEIETLWGQPLIDFHHELFEATYRPLDENYFHNISPWLARHGGSAGKYYAPVMAWFVRHAVLFENFTLGDVKELAFTRDIFLPAFIEVYKHTGHKPLIVNLLPTTIEGKKFWLGHPSTSKEYILSKLGRASM